MKKILKKLFRFSNNIWYGPILMFLALLDAVILIIPTDGILISSSMISRKRWLYFAINVAIGSTLGGLLIVYGIEHFGLNIVHELYPKIFESSIWLKTDEFFKHYGLIVLFIVGITPLTQQPALILAGLSHGAILPIFIILLTSRLIKFLIMSYVASHAPKFINKMWGVSGLFKNPENQIKN